MRDVDMKSEAISAAQVGSERKMVLSGVDYNNSDADAAVTT